MVNLKSILILFLMGIATMQFAQKPTMNKYKYDAGIGTPENFDIDTYQQVFYSENNEMIPINGMGVQLGGMWGSGGDFVVGDEMKEIPQLLKIGYYSYIENKFFEGEFKLPQNEIEKLLQEKTVNPFNGLEQPKYNYFSVGIALNGITILWIKGNENQKEIGRFQALEKHYDKFSDVIDDERSQQEIYEGWFKNYSEDLKKQITTNSLPYGRWDLYRKKYKLKINLSKKINWMQIGEINMEKQTTLVNNEAYNDTAIPYNVWFKWNDGDKKYEARIVFSKDEKYYRANYKGENGSKFPPDFTTEQTYKIFNSIDQNIPADLFINVNPGNNGIKILLKQNDIEHEISDFTFKIFSK